MKKFVISAIAALSLAGVAFAQEATVSFENEISSDVVTISGGEVEVAGISEQVTVEFGSDNVNAGVSLITELGKDDDDNFGLTGYEVDTAYVEFNPIEMLSIEFNNSVTTAGSYLPVADDNVGNGNISNDFALIVKPIENLSVGAGIKLPSVFGDSEDKVDVNAGVDYTTDLFSVGASLQSPINDLGFGVFGSYTGIEGLQVNAGFSYNDEFADVAGNIVTLGASYEFSIFTLGFDCVTNLGNEGNDLYTALHVDAGINDSLTVSAQADLNMDFDASDATEIAVEIDAAYVVGNHELSAGVAADITDSVEITLPVSYKYSF